MIRTKPLLVTSLIAIAAGVVGMIVLARVAPETSPYLLAPAPADLSPVLLIERLALVSLLLGLPLLGLAFASVIAPPRVRLPMKVFLVSIGLGCSGFVLLGMVWGTASSAEVLPIEMSTANALGRVSEFLIAASSLVGVVAIGVTFCRTRRQPSPPLP